MTEHGTAYQGDGHRKGISFLKLREGLCKFPLGALDEPVTRFCGAPAREASPYCEHCRQLAYVPNVRRVRLDWS